MKTINPPTFSELRDRLTIETLTMVEREHGKTPMKRQGLLQQLRQAVFEGMESSGGSASFGSKPPIDAAAVDLLNEITDQASQVLAKVSPNPTPYGHAESYVRLWAGQTTESQIFAVTSRATVENPVEYYKAHPGQPTVYDEIQHVTAMELMQRWVDRIESFFIPPSAMEIPAECPNCGARYYHRTKDGETIRSAALNILRDRDTGQSVEARCSVCTRTWPKSQFGFLAEMVGATKKTVVEKVIREKVVVLSPACDSAVHPLCLSMQCRCDCHTAEDHDPRLTGAKVGGLTA